MPDHHAGAGATSRPATGHAAGLKLPSPVKRRPAAFPAPLAPLQEEEGKRLRLSADASEGAPTASAGTSGGGAATASGADCFARRDSCESSATTSGSHEPPPLTEAVEGMLRKYLLRWGQRLVDLQPKVGAGWGGRAWSTGSAAEAAAAEGCHSQLAPCGWV